jgi:hypothetical protein
MPIWKCAARASCAVVVASVATVVTLRDPTFACGHDLRLNRAPDSVAPVSPAARTGLRLDRLSKGDLRTWRALEKVVAGSDAAGRPRSPTLRGLWDWAHATRHVLHVEMVERSEVAFGEVGLCQLERVDSAGLSHSVVIRLCPRNIRLAKASRGPNSVLSFVRFEGLTGLERHAEVLAHELAHAHYFLDDPERVAQLEAAKRTRAEFLRGAERAVGRLPEGLRRRLEESTAVLAATEAHAESVEAAVLRELAANR